MRKKKKIAANIKAVILLSIFVLASMPKQWIHNLLFYHTHSNVVETKYVPHQLMDGTYNCNWTDIVVSLPFTATGAIEIPTPVYYYASYKCAGITTIATNSFLAYRHRGPPAII